MPGATRAGDIHMSGDDGDSSVLATGSPRVFINGRPAPASATPYPAATASPRVRPA